MKTLHVTTPEPLLTDSPLINGHLMSYDAREGILFIRRVIYGMISVKEGVKIQK
jgi:hypothetical protein